MGAIEQIVCSNDESERVRGVRAVRLLARGRLAHSPIAWNTG
jgi:hypothetical protein